MSRKGTICGPFLALVFAIPGFADLVSVAPGTAGSLPGSALNLTGDPFVTDITGTIDSTDRVAMFEIDITSPRFFSAYTVYTGAFGIPDPALFLFSASGKGVYANDDVSSSPVNTQSCLPSSVALGNPCPSIRPLGLGPLAAGDYFLAIAISGNDPLDASNSNIFSPLLSTDVVGPNPGVGSIAGWDDLSSDPNTDNAKYHIVISDTPEPATWPLTAVLGLGLILLRRRLRTR